MDHKPGEVLKFGKTEFVVLEVSKGEILKLQPLPAKPRSIFSRNIRVIKNTSGVEIKLVKAFKWRDKTYWQIENAFDMSAGRALCAITFYEEFGMRADADYLNKHCRAVDYLISSGKNCAIDIGIIHRNLKERVKLAPYPDHIYKLASVMYFDDSEDPFTYDFKYNMEKIRTWKEDGELLSFLVQQPLKELMPFGELAAPNLQTFLTLKQQENDEHLKLLDLILSGTS